MAWFLLDVCSYTSQNENYKKLHKSQKNAAATCRSAEPWRVRVLLPVGVGVLRDTHELRQSQMTQRRPNAWLAICLGLWLAAALWGKVCHAAPSQIVEQAFVPDPSGQMTFDEARQQPQQPYTGVLKRSMETSVVWVRLRIAPPIGALASGSERLRIIPAWNHSLSLYDPLQRDAAGQFIRLDGRPSKTPYVVQSLPIPVGDRARDLWLRLDPRGPTYLNALVQSVEDDRAKVLSDSVQLGLVIGGQSMMVLIGLMIWIADRKVLGPTLFVKQVVNLTMAVLNADLFWITGRYGLLPWLESGTYLVECLRFLNMAVSLWFFIKVMELFKVPRLPLQLLRLVLAGLALGPLLVVSGQVPLARLIHFALSLSIPVGLMISSLTCQRTPLYPVTGLGLLKRGAEHLLFSLVLGIAWLSSFPAGFYKTLDFSLFIQLAPIGVMCMVGVLMLVSWHRIRADRQRELAQYRQAELTALALEFERGERQRQQEFMSMLTHELKAPLSTVGMVIGSPDATANMKRHAELALASMRQVIDHCAQSVALENVKSPPHRVTCSLAVELDLRCDAQTEKARIRMTKAHGLPCVQADQRMLAVIFNNLLDNALKYSPKDSQIGIAIAREVNPQGAVQRVTVTNQALDGPLPDVMRLFQKYYRGDAVQRISGSGLGLHLSRLLARRQGGDLSYRADARAVTFTLVLAESPPLLLA